MKRTIFILAALGMTIAAHAQEGPEEGGFEWHCKPTSKNSMQCVVKNLRDKPADGCIQVVQICKRGEHFAYVCSGRLTPNSYTTKVIPEFTPKVGLFERCMGSEIRDRSVMTVQ